MAVALPYQLFMTLLCGYFMSCKGMMFKKPIMALIMFTMFFGGGLIPSYLNMRSLGLYNNLWALIIPTGVSVYNSIIVRSAIDGIPPSLFEAAEIDGANDLYILFRIVPRLIMPTLAVILLWCGVGALELLVRGHHLHQGQRFAADSGSAAGGADCQPEAGVGNHHRGRPVQQLRGIDQVRHYCHWHRADSLRVSVSCRSTSSRADDWGGEGIISPSKDRKLHSLSRDDQKLKSRLRYLRNELTT